MKQKIPLSILLWVITFFVNPVQSTLQPSQQIDGFRPVKLNAANPQKPGLSTSDFNPGFISMQKGIPSGHLYDHLVASFNQEDPPPTEVVVEPTSSPTATATDPPEPTLTATVQPAGIRPVVVLASYSTNPDLVIPGKEFKLELRLVNQGQDSARNLLVTIPAGDFIPLQTGGVLALNALAPGDKHKFTQPLVASAALAGNSLSTLEVKVNYTDSQGVTYIEAFTIALNLAPPVYSGPGATATPTPTATALAINRPQLVISGYQTDTSPLQPGTRFTLLMSILNTGNADAKRVTMIVGGANLNTTPDSGDNDPLRPESFTASGGEFTNFSPVDASNVQSLGDLAAGKPLSAQQSLIVNVTTNPGVYSLKISFAYLDGKGNLLIDDQVISLLVYTQPVVEINFYREPDLIYLGQPNILPIQIINLGRKSAVFGNMTLNTSNGQLINNTIFVGSLDMGGYYPMDVTWFPEIPGQVELTVSVDYTDDFNQPQVITRVLTLDVLEAPDLGPGIDPGMYPGEDPGGFQPEIQSETFWQKVLRFLSGFLGLDSQKPAQNTVEIAPPEDGGPTGAGAIITGPPIIKGP